MKNAFVLYSLLAFALPVVPALAQMVTYSGPVEYHFEITKTAHGGGIDGGYNWNVSVDERQIIEGNFYVTFTGNARMGLYHSSNAGNKQSFDGREIYGISGLKLADITEDILYINSVSNEGIEQKTSQACYDDRLVFKHNATPGDSRTERFGVNSTRTDPGKPVIEGGQILFYDNNYTLTLMGKMNINVTSENYSSLTQPCLDTVIPPKSISATTAFDFPIVVHAEKLFDNPEVLEGTLVQEDESGDDCSLCLGGLARMVHGDMNCSNVTKITTSWTLVRRTEECNATISYLKGDVKINGVPAEEGSIKVGAGDVIETGSIGSRMEVHLPGNETFRLGSKTRLVLSKPCNPATVKPPSKGQLVKGKIRSVVEGFRPDFEPNMRTIASGVRGQINNTLPLFYASADPDFVPCVFQHDSPLSGFSTVQQEDPEKAELIEGYQSLSYNQTAYYLDFEDGIVRDLTALRGTIRVEDEMGIRSMDVPEGTTVTQWEDGTQMTEIVILTK
ncbi:MAG: hypothetical protein JW973_14270 [Bacteroidales bacterium]|nr:hypothetical protein [Bacteroidales bacterium]